MIIFILTATENRKLFPLNGSGDPSYYSNKKLLTKNVRWNTILYIIWNYVFGW